MLENSRNMRNAIASIPNKKTDHLEEKLDDKFVRGDYDAVLSTVRENILEQQQCISKETLQTAYGIGVGSRQSWHKLKFRLQKTFPDRYRLYFFPKIIIHQL